jgi:Tol biopolymer transport system component
MNSGSKMSKEPGIPSYGWENNAYFRDMNRRAHYLLKACYLLIVVLLFSACRLHKKKSYDYSYYSNGTALVLFSVNDNRATRIDLHGDAPRLSPDGTELAYTDSSNGNRRIAVLDLDNDKLSILDSGCTNCYGPVWSPDGDHLAYNYCHDSGCNWSIAVIGMDNQPPVIVSRNTITKLGAFSPSWSGDGKKIIFQDMETVHIVDLKGDSIKNIPIGNLLSDPLPSSDAQFVLSGDESKLIFNMEVDDSLSDEEPPSALFAYDMHLQKAIRLSPKGYNCGKPSLKDGKVFIEAERRQSDKRRSDKNNVYSVDLDGKNWKTEFKNRSDFTFKIE